LTRYLLHIKYSKLSQTKLRVKTGSYSLSLATAGIPSVWHKY